MTISVERIKRAGRGFPVQAGRSEVPLRGGRIPLPPRADPCLSGGRMHGVRPTPCAHRPALFRRLTALPLPEPAYRLSVLGDIERLPAYRRRRRGGWVPTAFNALHHYARRDDRRHLGPPGGNAQPERVGPAAPLGPAPAESGYYRTVCGRRTAPSKAGLGRQAAAPLTALPRRRTWAPADQRPGRTRGDLAVGQYAQCRHPRTSGRPGTERRGRHQAGAARPAGLDPLGFRDAGAAGWTPCCAPP